jgi:hypothetical protein
MQGALDDNMLPAAQAKFAAMYVSPHVSDQRPADR